MLRLRSARDLGLATRWRFGFVPYGTHAASTPGAVYLDVGASAAGPSPGVLDHHREPDPDAPAYPSSAAIVAARPDLVYNHLLRSWLQRADDGRLPPDTIWEPLIVTHVFPDWDAAAATVLIEHLIENGELPPRTGELLEYTNSVDQGRWRMGSSDRRQDSATVAAGRPVSRA